MKKVMIVDDNALAAEGIEKNIRWDELDAQVSIIQYNSRSALEAMKEIPVDLIISDIEMPDLDGISMSKLALSINPQVKIILVSAYDKFEYAKRAIRLGVFDYIEKPLDYGYLTEKIKNAFIQLDKTRKNMELIQASRPLMTEKFFSDILHYPGEDASSHLGRFLEYLDLDFQYDYYTVLILEPEYTGEEKEKPDFAQFQLELLNILDLMKEHFQTFSNVYYLKEFESIIAIIGENSSSDRRFFQAVHNAVSEVTEGYKNYQYSLNMGIGRITESLWELPASYASASHALRYRFFFPHKNIFDARDALGKEFSLFSFMENTEEELIKLICAKDEKAIEKWLTSFFQDLAEKIQDKNLIFIRIYSLLGRILKFLYEMNLDTSDLEQEILEVYKQFDSFKTYEQFVKWITSLCVSAFQKLDSSMESYHHQVYNMALGYIKENFEHSSLCLSDIARHANISPAYLSSLYKKVSGQSISDTITSLRIDSACRYLKETNLSLKEISNKCGYANQYYFSNSFKKKLGISPSAYREQNQQGLLKPLPFGLWNCPGKVPFSVPSS